MDNNYLTKHKFCDRKIAKIPCSDLGIIVVIPCFNEPDLLTTLNTLWNCKRTINCSVEVIVVVNSGEDSSDEVLGQNNITYQSVIGWINDHQDDKLSFHIIHIKNLPKKHAGVGLARKIGMDEAVARFNDIKNSNGIIVCFDADCMCDKNYLVAIEKHFKNNPNAIGCSIYFEHPTEGNAFDQNVYDGIINYELFLRYYNQGLRYSGFSYAYHTVGSCMAVRSNVYQKQGGMNRRKAGEDFYFLHKIIPLGNFSEISDTCVIPSPRVSSRVPFGTGKAIEKWLKDDSQVFLTYHPDTFTDLRAFFQKIADLYGNNKMATQFPVSVQHFLERNNFEEKLKEIKLNSSNQLTFRKRFFNWFDGFMVLKYVHFARDNYYDQIDVSEVSKKLLILMKQAFDEPQVNILGLLIRYRELDKSSYGINF